MDGIELDSCVFGGAKNARADPRTTNNAAALYTSLRSEGSMANGIRVPRPDACNPENLRHERGAARTRCVRAGWSARPKIPPALHDEMAGRRRILRRAASIHAACEYDPARR